MRSESYVFKHALVRDTAYESMVRATRQDLHRRVANTLQQRFPDLEQHRPEILARHFEGAGEVERAVEYWHRAGDRALKRVAYIEATQQLERGLALLQTLPASRQRGRLEVQLLTTLGTVFFLTKGYAAAEVEQTFARARELCNEIGEEASLKVLPGIASVYIARSDREATLELLPLFDGSPSVATTCCLSSPVTRCSPAGGAVDRRLRRPAGAHHGSPAILSYRGVQALRREYGYDGGFFMYPYKMVSLWNLGYPDQAEALRQEFMVIAEQSGIPIPC